MSISQKLEIYYENQIKTIKNMENSKERDLLIGALVADLGSRSINAIAKALCSCWRKIKRAYLEFIEGKQISFELRGRKKVEEIYPNLIKNIKEICSKYENTDSHFKSETLFVDLNPKNLKLELIEIYGYDSNFVSLNTLRRILKELGYKLRRVSKSQVLAKIPETDIIFENVNETLKAVEISDESVAAISIDDKNKKKIGNIAELGKSYFKRTALDHDTTFDCNVTPFGILDLKTSETFVFNTIYASTSEYKVDCIRNYIKYKKTNFNIKKLIIFLDNGPSNSGRNKLWLFNLVELAKEYNIVIQLVYYPPYHSKYNKIERYWARLQIAWNGLVIDKLEKLVIIIGKVKWKGVKSHAFLNINYYRNVISISNDEFKNIENNHIIREEGIEKWSLIITPFKLNNL